MRSAVVPVHLLTIAAFPVLILLALSFCGDNALTNNKENTMLAPNLSATKTGVLDTMAGGAYG